VDLQLSSDLIDVEVNAAAVELCLTNYLSNAIKYADPSEAHSWAVISARREVGPGNAAEVVVRVTDNGIGVPMEKRDQLFERFYRAHDTVTEVEGTGLGLSIVRDTARSQGGRAWAEFPERGSEFAFSFPDRRRGADQRTPGSELTDATPTQGAASGASPMG